MPYDIETVIIGAGVIGLAIARELARSGQDVLVLEKNGHFGEETSSRNSEVIHAGIYYPKGSLKARLCVEGKALLYDYCRDFNISHRQIGKLIVATTSEELPILNEIAKKAVDNGVLDLEYVSKEDAYQMEPVLKCEGALLSPSTGIIDTHSYMLSLVGEIERQGGTLAFHAPLTSATQTTTGFYVISGATTLSCKNLINAAGLSAQQVAGTINGLPEAAIPQLYLAKGTYFTAHFPSPFFRLIYPVPNTASLGIHVTLDLAGQIRFGPDQEWVDHIHYEIDEERGAAFYEAIRRYYPDLPDDSLIPAYSGVRPKLQTPTGKPVDFCISGPRDHQIPGLVNLFGMESPGLTASLAIARHVKACLSD